MKNEKLVNLILELESNIPKHLETNLKVSNVSVGWQIAHSLLTVNGIIEALRISDPVTYKWQFKFIKYYVFAINKIPRGKGKAPSIVQPKTYDNEAIEKLLQLCKERLVILDSISPNKYFNHPYIGHLKKKEAIAFLCIHTKHHLKIVEEILIK